MQTGERPYQCGNCSQSFITKGHLQAHELTHSGEKPFVCEWQDCGKRYSRAGRLKIHERLHTGEKPFVCSYEGCEKSFREKGNLLNHERTHSGEADRAFLCDVEECGEQFVTADLLHGHIRDAHSGGFRCSDCNATFDKKTKLLAHKKQKHQDEEASEDLKLPLAKNNLGSSGLEESHEALKKRHKKAQFKFQVQVQVPQEETPNQEQQPGGFTSNRSYHFQPLYFAPLMRPDFYQTPKQLPDHKLPSLLSYTHQPRHDEADSIKLPLVQGEASLANTPASRPPFKPEPHHLPQIPFFQSFASPKPLHTKSAQSNYITNQFNNFSGAH